MAKTKQTPLQLDPRVFAVLDTRAGQMVTTRADLFRKLLARKLGTIRMDYNRIRPDDHPLENKGLPTTRWLVALPAELEDTLHKLCYLIGGGRPSTVASHLILELAGISPLSAGGGGIRWNWHSDGHGNLLGSSLDHQIGGTRRLGFTLAPQVMGILRDFAAEHYSKDPSETFSDILRSKLDIILLPRWGRGKCDYVAPIKVEKKPYNLTLLTTLADFLDEICRRLGKGDRGTVISHLILQHARISPLNPDFTLKKLESDED